ncbi:uracil-DNA glycosylase family protein [Candidatus Collierbacteria bacterium]|nr:uracil-DNA glycosylase family protein [Candidatus Collierbacteria bacterium]
MKRAIFIGQAMPRFKKHPHDWPTLNNWLYSIGLNDDLIRDNFHYSALVDYFPGSKNGTHRVPAGAEIEAERDRLRGTINDFQPEIIVPIGKLSITYCLGVKISKLNNYIGKTFLTNPYGLYLEKTLIIPFPHPSGASTWYRSQENNKLLQAALKLLKIRLHE